MIHPWNPLQRGVVTLAAAIVLASQALAQQPPVVNGIAAKVNGRVITKNEVGILLFPQMKRLEARFPDRGPEFEKQLLEAQKAVLQELIDRKTTLDQANPAPIKIDPKAIDEEVEREIARAMRATKVNSMPRCAGIG